MEDKLTLTGHINFKLFDKEGSLKDERDIKNVVVTAGKNYMAAWLAAASQAGYFMEYVGLGTGSTAAMTTDTALEAEIGTRAVGTISSSTNVWQSQATFIAGNATGAITEAAILSAASLGTMLARQVFPAVNKAASDVLQVTWQITLS
jgi:hypothetical protein